MNILVLEDSESKWVALKTLIGELLGNSAQIYHAATILDGEKLLATHHWNLYILDISMDLATSSIRPSKGGHAPLGGLNFINLIYMESLEAPTIIVTGFDAFPTQSNNRNSVKIVGPKEISSEAEKILGTNFIGCIRYGQPDWKSNFAEALREVVSE